MATAVQLSFSLRTSTNVQTVHLVGSWDNYKNQLPLSKDGSAAKPGSWRGTFRFQGATLKLGQRYWYYYIIDGYHVSHDPAKEYTTEPTTGRKLNILDVPGGKSGSASAADKRNSLNVAQGRALSPGKIQHPRPTKAYASKQIREADYTRPPQDVDDLTARLEGTHIRGYQRDSSPSSDSSFSSDGTSDSGSQRSSPSSLSSLSDRGCKCERYGITRKGDRVKLDCGGARCGYGSADSSSACSSGNSEEDSSEDELAARKRAAASRAPPASSGRKVAASSKRGRN